MSNVYSLGSHSFMDMSHPPVNVHDRVTYVSRTGANGTAIYRDAERGDFGQIQTIVGCTSLANAESLWETYHDDLAGVGTLTWQGQAFGDYMVDALLGNPEINPVLLVVRAIDDNGNLMAPGTATHLLACTWRVFPISHS